MLSVVLTKIKLLASRDQVSIFGKENNNNDNDNNNNNDVRQVAEAGIKKKEKGCALQGQEN